MYLEDGPVEQIHARICYVCRSKYIKGLLLTDRASDSRISLSDVAQNVLVRSAPRPCNPPDAKDGPDQVLGTKALNKTLAPLHPDRKTVYSNDQPPPSISNKMANKAQQGDSESASKFQV